MRISRDPHSTVVTGDPHIGVMWRMNIGYIRGKTLDICGSRTKSGCEAGS